MSRLGINTGNNPNDGQGDPLRVAMGKINSNFLELYSTLGDGFDLVSYANTAGISSFTRNLIGSPSINVSGILNTGITTTEHIEVRNITSTGVITATQFVGDGSQLTNVTALFDGLEVLDDNVRMGVARELNFGQNIISSGPDNRGRVTISVSRSTESSLYAEAAGVATFAQTSNTANYAPIAGFATVSDVSNTAFNADAANVANYASFAGVATNANYSNISGVSTVSLGLTGTPNITVNSVVADSYYGSGSNLSGIITSLVGGTSISIVQTNGVATINAAGVLTTGYVASAGYSTAAGVAAVAQGLIGTPNITVNNVTALSYSGSGSNLTGVITSLLSGTNIAIAQTNGVATINVSGILTTGYALIAGFSTSSNYASIAGYSTSSGISTVAQGLTGTPNITVGVITATSYNGSGSNLTGVITSLIGGTNVSIAQTNGAATINVINTNYSAVAGYSTVSGISTVAQGLTGTPNISVGQVVASGVVTATRFESVSAGATATIEAPTNININTITVAISTDLTVGRQISASRVAISSNLSVSGVSTLNNVVIGGATTALVVNGDARITGILTIGTSSITLNGNNDSIRIGTGLTITSTGSATYSGILTATSFSGSGSNLTGVVTSITAGAGISISQGTGNVTITGPNLSGYATTQSIVGFITAGALVGYATQGFVTNTLVGYATTQSIVGFITAGALVGYATQGFVTNTLVGYATQGYVNNSIVGFITAGALVGYATQGFVTNSLVGYATQGYVTNALVGYATQGYVTNALVGYVTQGYVDTQIGIRTFSGNYNDLTNKPFIPVNINDLSDVNAGAPSTGQVLKWSGTEWAAAADLTASGGIGIGLSDLSITTNPAGISSLTYNSQTGVFTFTPTGTVSYASSSGISTVSQGLTGTPNINVGQVGISSFLSVTGVTSFYNNVHLEYDKALLIGNNNELQLYHNATNSYIDNSSGNNLIIRTHGGSIQLDKEGPELMGVFNSDGSVELYYNNVKKFETLAIGATVTGTTFTNQLNVSGVSSFKGNINLPTDAYIYLGDSNQYYLQYDGATGSRIYSNTTFRVTSDRIILKNKTDLEYMIDCTANGSVDLYHNGSKKFATTNTGVTITGTTVTDQLSVSGVSTFAGITTVTGQTLFAKQLNVSGVVTATTFYGNVIGNITGSITDATNLTGGIATASQLVVSGVTTISQGRIQADAGANLRFGNLPTGSGSGRNIAIGDQVLVSLSGGSGRNIGIGELSYYDTTTGQYNIGIGERAGQKVTTGSYNVILGSYDGQTGLDLRTSSNNVVIADGQGNIRQYINSSGNVGIKTTIITEALTVAGIVSATGFYGTLNAGQLTGALPAIDGSALIGVVGSGSGVVIRSNNTPVGTAGTINFGSNLSVSFASGIATVSASITGINTSGTSTFNQLNVSGVSTFTNNINLNTGNLKVATDGIIKIGNSDQLELYFNGGTGQTIKSTGDLRILTNRLLLNNSANDEQLIEANQNGSVALYYDNSKKFETLGTGVTVTGTTFTNQLSISGNTNSTGIITASSFSGSGSGLTNLPAGQLTGTLPAIDGSQLLNVTASGTGIVIKDDNTNVGSAVTVNFGTGLDVTFNAGIATINASGGSLKLRTTVSGTTTSIANNGIGNTDITGFKAYSLMRVGLSTAGWIRLYTDSTSRANDVTRSVGEDPAPGSGVIAEVVTTGISTQQMITPFVMGGNMDSPVTDKIYVAITNLSGTTQTITANLTILQLEA